MMASTPYQDEIARLAELVTAGEAVRSARLAPNLTPPVARVSYGRTYARVDIDHGAYASARYMVDLRDGTIYGVKGYGVVHKGHRFGHVAAASERAW